ncbi:hypothetical protein SK128_020909 [Halocaridina rubra]|uniref:Uncharacterized protein n=1 Tax=Halocaridina rubra TaxID=373956 RepID=A0AAN8X017_HALRR
MKRTKKKSCCFNVHITDIRYINLSNSRFLSVYDRRNSVCVGSCILACMRYYAEEAQLRRQSGQNGTTNLIVSNTTNSYPLPIFPHTGSRTHPPSDPQNNHVGYANTTNATSTPSTIINTTNIPGNNTISRPGMGMIFPQEGGFGLNKLSYVGPIVMGFGGKRCGTRGNRWSNTATCSFSKYFARPALSDQALL